MSNAGIREQGTRIREDGVNAQDATEMAAVKSAQVVTSIAPAKMTLADVRAKLDGKTGKRYWKNLDELSNTPEFQELMQEEFPRQAGAGEWVDAVSRRGFLKVMGASFALAGLAGCTKQPDEPIFPYVKQPEDLILGKPMYFATAHPFPTGAIPILVKSDAFRPIKIEGNPEHPMSKGKSDAYTQATLLDLYDPDRSTHVRYQGNESEYGRFQQAFTQAVGQTSGGEGVYFLSESITSPTLAAQWKQVKAKFPAIKLVQYEPASDTGRAAAKAAFGDDLDVQYKLEDADVILSLDADFLGGIHFPGHLPMAAAYAERHRYDVGKTMNRMYVVETMPTVTGYKAEHRLGLKPSEIDAFVSLLGAGTGAAPIFADNRSADVQKFASAVLDDLKKTGGRCAVIAGPTSSAAVHGAAHALNASLGAVGRTVMYTQSIAAVPAEPGVDIKSLVADMNAGKVKWLVMLGTNPLYNAPADLDFQAAFNKVPVTVHLGTHLDETGFFSTWHINKAHYLESWSDARAYDGTISIVQPMIDPLYGGRSAHDVLQTLIDPSMSAYDVVVANAKTYITGDFATGWRKALHDGWVDGTAFTAKSVGAPTAAAPASVGHPGGNLEISFKHDPSLYDGRFANNPWLQELPKPITSLSWDNAALMSMDTMIANKIEENDAIELELNETKVVAPVLMVPGHPNGCVTVYLGGGRRGGDGLRVGQGVGFNAYALRTSDQPGSAAGLTVKRGQGSYDLCVTKVHAIEHRGSYAQRDLNKKLSDKDGVYSLGGHEAMERAIIRYATLEEVTANPKFAHGAEEGGETNAKQGSRVQKEGYNPLGDTPAKEESMFPNAWSYENRDVSTGVLQNKWGMAIDLNSCVACNACVVACYAENNIPTVGREQVKIGRNMQWLRIDTYFEGDLHAPKAHFQPMACQHCENAGCELVCPVGATVHTPEGLNTMVYNRCVGTRYCSNNCPYKVRRFNFLLYSDFDTESLKFMRNPDVSVRSRGVMEKCSYCVQRIEAVKIQADKENRAIKDGEIVTACQQACPTDAILFGNLNDPNSAVSKRKAEERDYPVLGDLNYRPRTTYTAGVINPNPTLELA